MFRHASRNRRDRVPPSKVAACETNNSGRGGTGRSPRSSVSVVRPSRSAPALRFGGGGGQYDAAALAESDSSKPVPLAPAAHDDLVAVFEEAPRLAVAE